MKMPNLILTHSFKKQYKLLTAIEQKQAKKSLRFLSENPRHPSLQVHRVNGTPFWEAYVNKDIRMVFEQNGDSLVLIAIGHHDILRRL
jgi:mRNA-degrading endonuclease YafQ of YafQ-DinJ toxin-antitoxin module